MRTLVSCAALLLLSACAATPEHQQAAAPGPQTATAQQAEQVIGAAEAAQKKAAAAKAEWRDTGALITEAKDAARQGAFDSAVKKAGAAQRQSELALAQSEREKGAAKGK